MTDHTKTEYDVIIVGAGPAGLCAAMYAGRGMLKALTIERGAPGGELLNTDLIEDYIGFESIKGWELAQKMAEHAKKFGAEIVTDTVEQISQERAFANPKIEMIWNKQVVEIKGTERGIHHLELADTGTGERSNLLVGGVFVFIGFKPNTGLVEPHFKHDAGGYFITDDRMMSSIPGLFVAGDVRSQLTRQITTAVGDATTAAIAVEKYLAKIGRASCRERG